MRRAHQRPWAEILHDASEWDMTLDVEPDDRAGAPLPNRSKARLRRMLFSGIIVSGIAWVVASDPERAQGWLLSAKSMLDTAVTNAREYAGRVERERAATQPAMNTSSVPTPPTIAPLEDVRPAHDETIAPAASATVAVESMGTAYAETPEPAAEAKDNGPKRQKAIAAGLSPDLPNVLLSRLSEADLKNAAYAISTALAKTASDASFAWPPKPSQQQALFEVRFVPGADQGCRRYIVTVTKDRWSSTSAAIEKCGKSAVHEG